MSRPCDCETIGIHNCLFRAVESEQGFAYISDGLDAFNASDMRAIARGSLHHSRRVVRILERWLRQHDDGETRRMMATGSGKGKGGGGTQE